MPAAFLVAGEFSLRAWASLRLGHSPQAAHDGFHAESWIGHDDKTCPKRFDPELGYRLAENFSYGGFRTNGHGLRGKALGQKTGNARRILCLGDSTTFGWSLPENYTYPVQLEKILGKKHLSVEVVNGGFPGYRLWQMLGWLKRDGIGLKPDLIIFYGGWNDILAMRDARNLPAQKKSSLLFWLQNESHLYKAGRTLVLRGFQKLPVRTRRAFQRRIYENATPQDFQSQLEALAQFCREKGIDLILCTLPCRLSGNPDGALTLIAEDDRALFLKMWPRYNEAIWRVAREKEIPLVDLEEKLRPLAEEGYLDLFHPRGRTCLAIARALAPQIQALQKNRSGG